MSNEPKTTDTYTSEFKDSAVKLAIESSQPVARTARELDISPSTLYSWINAFHRKSGVQDKQVHAQHVYDELRALRRENARLKEEHTLLKKAPSFAKHSN